MPMKTFLKWGVLFPLLICLSLLQLPHQAIAQPVGGNLCIGAETDVSCLIVSFEAPLLAANTGDNRCAGLASMCEELLRERGEAAAGTLLAQLADSGGIYRILCHRQLMQFGVFFPRSFPNPRVWVQRFFNRLQQRLPAMSFNAGPLELDDLIYQRLISPQTGRLSHPRVSVFAAGSLQDMAGELAQRTERLNLPVVASVDGPTDQLVLASHPPALVCLAEWSGPEEESLARAQFASELLARAALPVEVRRNVLSFAGRAFLEIVATSTQQNIGEFQALAEGISRVVSRQDCQESWAEFTGLRRQLLTHDRHDLFKDAFVRAWEQHFEVTVREQPASMTWVPPNRFQHWLCLPEEQMHRYMCETSRKPSVVACRIASGTGVEVAVLISRQAGQAPGQAALKAGLSVFEDLGLFVTVLSDAEFIVQSHVEQDQLANFLATVRAVFLEQFLRSEAAGTGRGSTPDMRSEWNIHIAAVGAYPPYMLINSLRKGWPAFGDSSPRSEDPMRSLALALDVASASPDLVKGRWQLTSSSITSLTRTIVRYVSRGAHIKDLIPLVGPF